jgi:redox-sensitive bicupin YhaK (pirin superfamily)
MTHFAGNEPARARGAESIVFTIEPRTRDLGGFSVRRVLPARQHRTVGPFVFFDHVGPASFPPGQGMQVRPHPHIGLATITYLFEGEIVHRDSLGFVQSIQAGAVNLMTAGRGIVHSERAADLHTTSRLHGIQTWIALPVDQEDRQPAFAHVPASAIPELDVAGVKVRVIMGEAYGHTSPVSLYTKTLYLECRLPQGRSITLPDAYAELAFYVVCGAVRVDQRRYAECILAVAKPGKRLRLEAGADSHLMIIGGDSVGPRHIWWNFVASSAERIERAKSDWREGRFPKVPGETELIPLPD